MSIFIKSFGNLKLFEKFDENKNSKSFRKKNGMTLLKFFDKNSNLYHFCFRPRFSFFVFYQIFVG